MHVSAPPVVTWPHRVGVVPLRVDCYQDRPLPDGPALVLSGLGGTGKTQLATELAERAWSQGRIDLLVWVSASSRQAVLAGYAQAAAEVLHIDVTDQDQAAGRLLAWLASTERRWLVVLDDVTDPADLRGLWPPQTANTPPRPGNTPPRPGSTPPRPGDEPRQAGGGRTVVTTRRLDDALTGAGRTVVDVGLFTAEQSVAYLTERLTARPVLADDAAGLAGALGHLPLALAQAAAFLLDQEISCGAYRALLADREVRLDDLRPATLPDDQDRALAATWSLSVELADRTPHPGVARRVLTLASVLDSNGVPEELLQTPMVTSWLTAERLVDSGFGLGSDALRQALWLNTREPMTRSQRLMARINRRITRWTIRRLAAEPVTAAATRDTTRRLHLLSLAAHDPDGHTVRVHALVQRATREGVPSGELAQVVRVAADALAEAWESARQVPVVGQAFFANIRALTEAAPEELWSGAKGPHAVLVVAADILLGVGQARAAADYLTELAAEAGRRLGPEHLYTLAIRQTLSAALGRAGDQAGAVAVIEAAYADAMRSAGVGWQDMLSIRHNLATAWYKAGRVEEAATEMESLVADSAVGLGRYKQFTLYNVHQLAHLRGELGDSGGAVVAYEKLLFDSKRLPADEAAQMDMHVRVQLAHWRGRDGKAAAAVADLEKLLAEKTPVLGPHHRRVLAIRQELAHWVGVAGDPAGAVAAYAELLADWLLVQAPDSLDTMTTRRFLAQWRGAAGDPEKAVAELEDLLADQLRVLSTDHPDTRATREELTRWRAAMS
ncbi:NB-ARC domain-containing protein [Actinoplanes sp. NPDC051861]|uniref:NB-ARC domain-containing protein n=1 Tax=Actinoplanes sp. NPDC051861 TaxID=3155170 RepID=UPI003434F394